MIDLAKDETMRVARAKDLVLGAVIYSRVGTKLSVRSKDADGDEYFRLQMDLDTYPDRHLLKADDTGERLMRPRALRSLKFYVLRETDND